MNYSVNSRYDVYSPQSIINDHLATARRLLIFGESGIGKSTLASQLTLQLKSRGRDVSVLSADPGSPDFGIPGAICLANQQSLATGQVAASQLQDFEALCSLDAGRFRLPLAMALRTLLARTQVSNTDTLIIDAPGVTRGVAGAELLPELISAADIDLVLTLVRQGQAPPLINELTACGVELVFITAHSEARLPDRLLRRKKRSNLWRAYLNHATEHQYCLDQLLLLGTPPPVSQPAAWVGRQVALLDNKRTLTMGIVTRLDNNKLGILTPDKDGRFKDARRLLVRDALQTKVKDLHTARPFRAQPRITNSATNTTNSPLIQRLSQDPFSPPILMRVGEVQVTLVNGVFGDPLLVIRLGYKKRCLLFDLGDPGQLPARIAHQVSDVFISHCHFDHIAGFLWLLRSRIGHYPTCRLFGPPGLARNIAGMIDGILWDRIGNQAPGFEIFELHGQELRRWQITAGCPISAELPPHPVTDGVIWQEPAFKVRAVTLDHTPGSHKEKLRDQCPVLAFAFEPATMFKVRKDQLSALKLKPGPWLRQLKECVIKGRLDAQLQPADRAISVAELAAAMLVKTPGLKLAYATDFADIPANHARLTGLAQQANSLFCEATFVNADADRATATGHLTTRACGKLGTEAAVEQLIPFHFSRRYQANARRCYQEVRRACSHTLVPDR